jgi:hypothetical protein
VQVLCSEVKAKHTGPESCVALREERGEALTGGGAGQPWSPEKCQSGSRRSLDCRKATWAEERNANALPVPAWSENLARTQALYAGTGRSRGGPQAARLLVRGGKVRSRSRR